MADEMYFEWTPDLNIGIEAIDEQHKVLVNIFNRLSLAVSKGEGGKVIRSIVDSLRGYTKSHFALEEKLLAEAGYDELAPHTAQHSDFIAKLDDLTVKFLVENSPAYSELIELLRNWLIEHIRFSDRKYSQVLVQTQFSTTAWERKAHGDFYNLPMQRTSWWKFW